MKYLVCGYKRTGKDYLFKMFNNEIDFNWVVYTKPNSDKEFGINDDNRINKDNRINRVGFADALREEVNNLYDVRSDEDYDVLKEMVIKDGRTYRDLLIEHAAFRRNQNIDYWISLASKDIISKNDVMITDWRYPNEVDYLLNLDLKITTIRVFRSEVPIPPVEMISEHQLDDIVTDFLLVPENEFNKACEIFPQYKSYVRLN